MKTTTIDLQKAAAEILITAAYGGSFDISSRVDLSGRGVKSFGNGNYHVTDAALTRIKSAHSWAADF